jgi:hypothetical protein
MAFRITPSLGPDLEQHALQYYWDLNFPDDPSYQLGSKVIGSDGHEYVFVEAAANIASAGTDVTINETTWVATAGAGTYETPVDNILAGEFFHARKILL